MSVPPCPVSIDWFLYFKFSCSMKCIKYLYANCIDWLICLLQVVGLPHTACYKLEASFKLLHIICHWKSLKMQKINLTLIPIKTISFFTWAKSQSPVMFATPCSPKTTFSHKNPHNLNHHHQRKVLLKVFAELSVECKLPISATEWKVVYGKTLISSTNNTSTTPGNRMWAMMRTRASNEGSRRFHLVERSY